MKVYIKNKDRDDGNNDNDVRSEEILSFDKIVWDADRCEEFVEQLLSNGIGYKGQNNRIFPTGNIGYRKYS